MSKMFTNAGGNRSACAMMILAVTLFGFFLMLKPNIFETTSCCPMDSTLYVGSLTEAEISTAEKTTTMTAQELANILNNKYRNHHSNKFGDWDNRDFNVFEENGLHITPVHFYSALPDFSKRNETFYEERVPMHGISFDPRQQIDLAVDIVKGTCVNEFQDMPSGEHPDRVYEWHHQLGFMDKRDSLFLYCLIRNWHPRRIIEIGGGASTMLMAAASRKNKDEGKQTELCTIEPHPVGALSRYYDGESVFPGLQELIVKNLEEVDIDIFSSLEENDILFIDSSHVFREGGDVELELMHIIPTLKKGVIIHIHDILLPRRYLKNMQANNRYYTEQYFLWAFLAFNTDFQPLWVPSWVAEDHQQEFPEGMIQYTSDSPPDSFWMVRTNS